MHVQKFLKEQMKVAGERISWPAVFFCVPDRGIGWRAGRPSWLAGRQEAWTVWLWRAVEKEGEVCGCLYVQICWTGELQRETKQMFACVVDGAYKTRNSWINFDIYSYSYKSCRIVYCVYIWRHQSAVHSDFYNGNWILALLGPCLS